MIEQKIVTRKNKKYPIKNYSISKMLLILILIISLTPLLITAKEVNSNAGTSAFSFLKINASARAVAMGSAFTGLADDESALYYNPAGIASLERNGLILGYHNYFVGLQSGLVGIIRKHKEKHYFGASIQYLNYGNFIQTNNSGDITGEFGGGDLLLALTYATRYNRNIYVGATTKLIYEKIQDFSASGFAVDFGLKYTSDRGRYSGGLMIQNVGFQLSNFTDTEKDGLPTTFRLGGAIKPRGLKLLFAGDVVLPTDNDLYVALGAEYYELHPLMLRVGWNSFGSNFRAANSNDSGAGFALGLGFNWEKKQISYSFSPGAELGDSHRITLTGGL